MGKISDKWLKEKCKIGTPKACRFITCGADGFSCEKNGMFADTLNARAKNKQMRARGDNCNGV
jgi:hypothetical protein